MFDIIYLCKTDCGETFSFMSKAILDMGIEVVNDMGEKGIIEDMVVKEPISASEIHMSYELMRALSM